MVCRLCKKEIRTRYRYKRKYCPECSSLVKKLRMTRWKNENRDRIRSYHRKYMQKYRSELKALKALIIAVVIALAGKGYCLNASFQFTKTEPLDYQAAVPYRDGYWLLTRLRLDLFKGWYEELSQEDMELFREELSEYEQNPNTGKVTLEYGNTNTISELSLIEDRSVYGWSLIFGENSNVLAGSDEYGDRVVIATLNNEKFKLAVWKVYGLNEVQRMTEQELQLQYGMSFYKPYPRYINTGIAIGFPYRYRNARINTEIGFKRVYVSEESPNSLFPESFYFRTGAISQSFFTDRISASYNYYYDYYTTPQKSFNGNLNIKILTFGSFSVYGSIKYSQNPTTKSETQGLKVGYTRRGFSVSVSGNYTKSNTTKYPSFVIGATVSYTTKNLSLSFNRNLNYNAQSINITNTGSLTIRKLKTVISGSLNETYTEYSGFVSFTRNATLNLKIWKLNLSYAYSFTDTSTSTMKKQSYTVSFSRRKLSVRYVFNSKMRQIQINRRLGPVGIIITYLQTPTRREINGGFSVSM